MIIELRLLRHAIALGQHRNFARAAEALSLTQPTLSRSIAALEEALGVPLFDRSHKGVTPTPYGRVLLERGEAVVTGESDLRREIRLLAGLEVGSLAIGAGPYASEVSVAAAVARVADAHPNLQIRVTTSDPVEVVRDVLAQRVDVGVADRTGPDADERLSVESVPPHPIVLACRPGHPLASVPRPSAAQVMSFPLVTTLVRGPAAAAALFPGAATPQPGSTTGDFVPQLNVNSLPLARLIARQSNALFPGTAGMLAEDIAAGHLVLLDFRVPAMQTNYGVIYLRGRTLAPAARAFIAALHAVEAEAQIASATPRAGSNKAAPGKRRARNRA
jgi:DNA-binding transcriptional LysR family regulator